MSTVDTDVDDPFADAETARVTTPEAGPLRRGRYYLPRMDGTHKPRGWMRVSNLVSAYSDQYALRIWEHLEVLKALAKAPELLGQLPPLPSPDAAFGVRRQFVENWLTTAKAVSGGDLGSRHGTQRHAAVEELHAGLPPARHDAGTRRHLALYVSALQRHQLVALPQMQERIIHVPVLEVCGRIDNILEDVGALKADLALRPEADGPNIQGPLVIGDLKTQRKFHTFLEIGAQFACYANAEAMWNAELGRWEPMPVVSKDVALALWMPRETEDGEPRVDLYEIDIRKGWKTAQRAYGVVLDRADAKSVKGRRGWLRTGPEATETERWAARFAAVDSLDEGTRLVLLAREAGVWDAALAASAKVAVQRLTGTQNLVR